MVVAMAAPNAAKMAARPIAVAIAVDGNSLNSPSKRNRNSQPTAEAIGLAIPTKRNGAAVTPMDRAATDAGMNGAAMADAAMCGAASRLLVAATRTIGKTGAAVEATATGIGMIAMTTALTGSVAHGIATTAAMMTAMAMAGIAMKAAGMISGMTGAMIGATRGVITAGTMTIMAGAIGATTGVTIIAGTTAGAMTVAMTGADIATNIAINTAALDDITHLIGIIGTAGSALGFTSGRAFISKAIG